MLPAATSSSLANLNHRNIAEMSAARALSVNSAFDASFLVVMEVMEVREVRNLRGWRKLVMIT